MAKNLLAIAWLASLVLAVYVGYQLGEGEADPLKPQEPGEFNQDTNQYQPLEQSEKEQQSDSPVPQFKQDLTATSDDAPVQDPNKHQRLADTGAVFARKSAVTAELTNARDFAENYSEDDLDWQAKTNITDFLQLHEDAERIDLQKIICDERRCQLIGQYGGEHQHWEAVLKAMREQDWWDYTGTSSSSYSEDEQTYFNVFLNKPESQDN